MTQKLVFVNRRRGTDRRFDLDPCKNIAADLYHRKRRKSAERRNLTRSLIDDYYAYMQKTIEQTQMKSKSQTSNTQNT
ncbi:hypothetical protein [Agarilytica rhodophyticola]|uniref:hypothetical protein n=1 Tax=Agarilytica rhodophyticola TaxID=1737490 RepID=UPI000B348B4E|nr:hypothetical protein [Agarilytica rhodophyticola]